MRTWKLKLGVLAFAFAAMFGCQPADNQVTEEVTTAEAPVAQTQEKEVPLSQQPLVSVTELQPAEGDEVAVLETGMGRIVLMFLPDKAPLHVANFKKLVKDGFYDGTRFHRVIPGFMIQGGDPNTKGDDRGTWGTGGPDESVRAEFNNVRHERGVLSMARSQHPDSAGSQFFIVHKEASFLDRQYTAFGRAVEGLEVVDKIVAVPTEGDMAKDPVAIKSARLEKWPLK
jgi:peptidyl-prolyl cis-trans isomerase B (cyclophilin B)